jgi:pimeloyl-ACP methyl ester carboxylesterase
MLIMPRRRARDLSRIAAVFAATLFVACGGSVTAPEDHALVMYSVLPSDADPAIIDWNDANEAWLDPLAEPDEQQLLVFLPGTFGVPAGTRLFAQEAARAGYHVIGLMYPDDRGVVAECTGDPDPACMEHMRAEISFGEARSPYVEVDATNSIASRLLALVRLLAQRHPEEGWDTFIDADSLVWPRIVLSGHSQGGGHAAYMATRHRVARVIMFGAPADGFGGQPAPWMAIGATPADRYYGMAHARDPFLSIPPNWVALDLARFGPIVTVERDDPPYGGTHRLTTDRASPAGSASIVAHSSVVSDGATPRAPDGTPLHAPAWRYLLGRP